MKVTKRQLGRIIKEQYDRDVNAGWDYDPDSDPAQRAQADMEHMQYEEYKTWAKETGQVTPAASSVMATYFVEQGLTDDKAQIGMMASGYGIDPEDVMRDIKRQQVEYDAGGVLSDEELYQRSFKEGKIRITKRQLRRIIRESLIKEYNGYGPGSRNEPGHRDPESGNWVDPGMDGYNPHKDKTLGPDGGWPPEERSMAIRAYTGKDGYIANSQVDPRWKHPAFRRR